jgi:hypothetical protein
MPMVEIDIRQDTTTLAERRAAQKQRRLVTRIVVATSLAIVAVLGGIVISQFGSAPAANEEKRIGANPQQADAPPAAVPAADTVAAKSVPAVSKELQFVDDDGRTLWAPPTAGPPLSLKYLPSESQLILVLRPAELVDTGELEPIIAGLGPRGQPAVATLERAAGLEWASIEQLVLSLHFNVNNTPEIVLVVTPREPHGATTLPGLEIWKPEPDGKNYVVASPGVLAELRDAPAGKAALTREFDQLLDQSDSERHILLLVSNRLVASPNAPMWQDQFGRLRESVFRWLPDEVQAFALGLHWDEKFFAELRVVATLDQRPEKLAENLHQKLTTWPALAEQQVTSLSLEPYGQKVIARWPAMLREVVRYVRSGREGRCALLRCYLPRPAGHNLLLAGELVLAESYGGLRPAENRPAPASEATLAEKLQATTSLSFARDTLEMALQMLSEDTGIPIELVGADLQLDGITKNQSFGLDMKERPAGDILVGILLQANPDKTATGPADPKQKLVYVVVNGEGGSQTIKVTTRSQAEKRGETLPRVFLQ